ncbi:MAG: right-handed parallel beta-helix repeat-containing protein, partial [Candidatus Hodarchaeales archaeon]
MNTRRTKKRLSLFFTCLFLFFYPLPLFLEISLKNSLSLYYTFSNDPKSDYTIVEDDSISSPIIINGNTNFRDVATRETWEGDGSAGNPYLIQSIHITDPSRQRILIEIIGTTVYFHIDNCSFTGGDIGISFHDVSYGSIRNSTVSQCNIGISFTDTIGCRISQTEISESRDGIRAQSSTDCVITNNEIKKNNIGMSLHDITDGFFFENEIFDNHPTDSTGWWGWSGGISIDSCSFNEYISNTVVNNSYFGITMRGDCDGNNLTRNIITKNEGWGIEMYGDSNLNLIHNNSIIDNRDGGLFLDECPLNRITGNKFEKNGIYISGWLVSDYFQSEVANNTVNEKPLLFKQRETNIEFDSISYGQIILLECDEIIVKDQIILDTDCGILIRTCSNIEITNCTLQNIIHSGIHLANSNYVKISNCTLTNLNEGVTVSICVDIEIDNNTIKNCTYGIFLTGSNFSNITHNSLINNEQGLTLENSNINEIYANKILNNSESSLSLRYSLDNTISYNNITGGGTGISLYGSSSNRISNNNLISQGLSLEGWDRFHFVQADVSNNTVNGKPLIYWEDAVGDTIPEAGQIILIDCNDLQITDQNLSHASVGVFMYSCSNISIVNNQISHNNMYGIHGYSLIDGVIAFNNITVNGEGISVEDCNTINISNNFVINNSQRGILASFVQGPNLFLYDDHVYQLIRESMTWTEAQTFCEDIQGHLVTISSNEENLIVQSLIDGMTAWIGYTDEENEGTWAWITGESKNFSNWEVGEPNDAGGEDYAEIYEDGHWNDASGNY